VTGDRIVVVGGGLAGITASLLLAEAGLPVTVIEGRPWLGGATWSFGRRGLTIDNGQHVFLRCFTAYRELLAKLGVSELAPVQDRLDFSVVTSGGPVRLRRSGWPAPTHLAPILARYRPLPASQRLAVLPAATAMWLSDLSVPANADISIGEWLGRHGQDEQAVRLFWELFLAPFMNASAADTDLGTAASFMNVALLSRRDHADLGIPAVPLRELHAVPAARRLAELGAEVRLGAQVTAVCRAENGGYVVHLDAGKTPAGEVPGQLALGDDYAGVIDAAGVVLAVPAASAAAISPEELAGEQASWGALRSAPVVSVHVIYDTQVTRLPYALAAGSPLRWIADKTGPAGLHTGQYLAASVPAAGQLVDEPPGVIREMALPELERLFPAAAMANVDDFFVTRERNATFLPAPGSRTLRPDQVTSLPGLALAGAWTDTGWPDTMEGAVRSGRLAAEAILRAVHRSAVSGPAERSAAAATQTPALDEPAGSVAPVAAEQDPELALKLVAQAQEPEPVKPPSAERPEPIPEPPAPAGPPAPEPAESAVPEESAPDSSEPAAAVPELRVVPSPPDAADSKVPAQRGRQQPKQAARPSRAGPADGRAAVADDRAANGGAANGGAANGGAANGGAANGGAANGGAANGGAANGGAANDRPANDRPASDRAANGGGKPAARP
jgi:squalene-associated FAD-dependent desaturase